MQIRLKRATAPRCRDFATSPESSRFAESGNCASDGRSGGTASIGISSEISRSSRSIESGVILSDFEVISRSNTLRDDTEEKQVLQQALPKAVQQNTRE